MKSEIDFEKNLVMGTSADDIVHSYLKQNNRYVMDCRNMNHGPNHGPRLEGTEGIAILPDFMVKNKPPKESFAVDVKAKSRLYPIDGVMCFTVDKKILQYKVATQLFGLDYLAIIFFFEGKLYQYRDSEYFGTKDFDNEFSTGTSYLFRFDKRKQVY